MSENRLVAFNDLAVSKFVIAVLISLCAFGVFFVGFDQGHMFSLVQGAQAFDDLLVHELVHDMRHAAGYPCH